MPIHRPLSWNCLKSVSNYAISSRGTGLEAAAAAVRRAKLMESKENMVKQKIVMAGLATVVPGAGTFVSLHKTRAWSPQQGRMKALKQLRDTGVINAHCEATLGSNSPERRRDL